MTYKSLHILLASLLIVSPVYAQEISLSPSEQAALSQRGITDDERALRAQGCSLWDELTQTIRFANGIQGWLAEVPDMAFLLQISAIPDPKNPGKFAITAFPLLPNGGIGSKDFCTSSTINLGPDALGSDSVIMYQALLLRSNLDVRQEYPNTSQPIFERGQIRVVPGGRFALIALPEDDQTSAMIEAIIADPMYNTTSDIIRLGSVILVPLR